MGEKRKEEVTTNMVQEVQIPEVIEYAGKRVLTTAQLAECYGTNIKAISKNFSNNKDKFVENVHYKCLTGDDIRAFRETHDLPLKLTKLYIWSERGVLLHAKSLNTDRAWAVYERLIDFYFNNRQQQTEIQSQQQPQGNMTTPRRKLLDNGILASRVYAFLGLSKGNFYQWVQRNITGNRFAIDGIDYTSVDDDMDYIISQSLFRRICLMSKTDKGEWYRNEYIGMSDKYEAVVSALTKQDEAYKNVSNEVKTKTKQKKPEIIAGLSEKRMLNLKEFCIYSGLGKTKARSYAEEKELVVHIGTRVLFDRVKFDRLCDSSKA
jgi:phage anti-repressor protein